MRRAFTLLEFMAVLLLLALVASAVGTLSARSSSHSTHRVWRTLDIALHRCSAMALAHNGGELETETLTFTSNHETSTTPFELMTMPSGWSMHAGDDDSLRFDARGRCESTRFMIRTAAGVTLSVATLDGVTLSLETGAPQQ